MFDKMKAAFYQVFAAFSYNSIIVTSHKPIQNIRIVQ